MNLAFFLCGFTLDSNALENERIQRLNKRPSVEKE